MGAADLRSGKISKLQECPWGQVGAKYSRKGRDEPGDSGEKMLKDKALGITNTLLLGAKQRRPKESKRREKRDGTFVEGRLHSVEQGLDVTGRGGKEILNRKLAAGQRTAAAATEGRFQASGGRS